MIKKLIVLGLSGAVAAAGITGYINYAKRPGIPVTFSAKEKGENDELKSLMERTEEKKAQAENPEYILSNMSEKETDGKPEAAKAAVSGESPSPSMLNKNKFNSEFSAVESKINATGSMAAKWESGASKGNTSELEEPETKTLSALPDLTEYGNLSGRSSDSASGTNRLSEIPSPESGKDSSLSSKWKTGSDSDEIKSSDISTDDFKTSMTDFEEAIKDQTLSLDDSSIMSQFESSSKNLSSFGSSMKTEMPDLKTQENRMKSEIQENMSDPLKGYSGSSGSDLLSEFGTSSGLTGSGNNITQEVAQAQKEIDAGSSTEMGSLEIPELKSNFSNSSDVFNSTFGQYNLGSNIGNVSTDLPDMHGALNAINQK